MGTRTLNTKRNIIFSYLNTTVTTLFQFVFRYLIIRTLGSSYLGLSSLFISILQVLSMAEMGFSVAIVFHMYKPIVQNDTSTVCALLFFYRRVYVTIATIITVIGILVSPALPYLIKGTPPKGINLYVLYFLYLANTISSYIFFAYKAALLNALQRLDLTKIAYTIASLVQYILQIVALLVFRSYYGFVVALLLGTICKNILTAWLADKYFPQYKPRGQIDPAVRRDIWLRVRGLMICAVAGLAHTIDSIVLSSFIGLKSVAIYNNYILIFTGVGTFIAMIRTAMQASVGNSVATETKEKNYADMLCWQFMFSFIATWCCTCMFNLYQPFMTLWMGKDMLLPDSDVAVICLWFFLGIIQHSYFLYLAGNGLWWELRWVYSIGGLLNLFLNIVLCRWFGISGIIFASLVSAIVSGLIWQCNIIFREYFQRGTGQFYKRLAVYGAVCVVCIAVAVISVSWLGMLIGSLASLSGFTGLTGFNSFTGIGDLIIRVIVCTAISVGIQYIIYSYIPFTKKELERAKNFIKKS